MRAFRKHLVLGTITLGLASCVLPAVGASADIAATCLAPPHVTGWQRSCNGPLAGWRYLTLKVSSGNGFAAVVCTNGDFADLTSTGSIPYFAGGTCTFVAGGDGTGTASD